MLPLVLSLIVIYIQDAFKSLKKRYNKTLELLSKPSDS